VATSWREYYGKCKSRISAIARACYLGRQRWKEKYQEQVRQLEAKLFELEAACKAAEARTEQLCAEREEANQHALVLEQKLAELERRPVRLPDDPPAAGQQYGASLMALSINLGREIGQRKSVRAMKIFFKWLKVKQDIPTYQAVRTWMQRLGLNRMRRAKRKDDWIWIVDQCNQIGQDKCLVILGIERSKLPPEGTPLKLTDMTTLGVYPAKNWNCENVLKIYKRLAKKYGQPEAVVTDGAVELRQPVESLETEGGRKTRSIRDMKHFLSNRIEEVMDQDEQFQAFTKEMGQTRSSMQQSELSHLAPPIMRQKSRFMNLAPILTWSRMALWQLDNPESDGRKGIAEDRIAEKLGWLNKHKDDVRRWNELQAVISTTLTFINQNGLKHGTARELKQELKLLPQNSATCGLMAQTLEFVHQQETKLKPSERLPMSSEIIESSFARFKVFEQFHARSGFTQVLLAFPCLLKPTTAKEIVFAFAKTKIKDTKAWMDKHLPKTHDGRRQSAYREYHKALKLAKTRKCATPLAATG
jgi:hypothetical protein